MFGSLNQRLERTSLIKQVAADNTAQTLSLLSFTDASRFESYYLEIVGLTAAANGEVFSLTASADGGATWLAADYVNRFYYINTTNILPSVGESTKWNLHVNTVDANAPLDMVFYLNNLANGAIKKQLAIMAGCVIPSGVGFGFGGVGYLNAVTALDSLRITAANGNIVSGAMRIWGNRK